MKNTEKIKLMKNLKSKNSMYLSESLDTEKVRDMTVYFGTGLASSNAPSLGFGLDILSTILTSLKVKRILGANNVLHLISTTGYNISEATRDELILRQQEIMDRIISNLGISDEYKLILSSEFINTPEFKQIYDDVSDKLSIFTDTENFDKFGTYTTLQTAIGRYLYERENATIKIGWNVKDTKRPDVVSKDGIEDLIEAGRLNEFYFDEVYRYVFPQDDCSFIYTPPALGLDGRCSPPYTVTELDNRPLINEDPCLYYTRYAERMNNTPDARKKLRKTVANWRETIIEPYEELFGHINIHSENDDISVLMKLAIIQKEILRKRELSIDNTVKEQAQPESIGSDGEEGR